MTAVPNRPITRDDIEHKLRQIEHLGSETAESVTESGRLIAIAGVVVLVGVAYLLGRRHGRKRRTIVQISRV